MKNALGSKNANRKRIMEIETRLGIGMISAKGIKNKNNNRNNNNEEEIGRNENDDREPNT